MILLGLVAITIVSIVGYMAWQDRNTTPMIQGSSSLVVENSASTASTTTSTEETSTSSEATESSSTTESSEAKMTMTASDSTQSSITITMKDAENPIELAFTGLDASCWVGVQVDNAYVYQYTLQAGGNAIDDAARRRHECDFDPGSKPKYLHQGQWTGSGLF